MTSLRTAAKDVATSDAGKAFGWRKLPKDATLRSKIEILGENALKLSHWIPVVGTATGLLSLGLVVYSASNKKRLDDEDTSKITRSILAITSLPFILMFLDFAVTYLRKNELHVDDLADQIHKLDESYKRRAPKTSPSLPETRISTIKKQVSRNRPSKNIEDVLEDLLKLKKIPPETTKVKQMEEMLDQRREHSRIEESPLPYNMKELDPWNS